MDLLPCEGVQYLIVNAKWHIKTKYHIMGKKWIM